MLNENFDERQQILMPNGTMRPLAEGESIQQIIIEQRQKSQSPKPGAMRFAGLQLPGWMLR